MPAIPLNARFCSFLAVAAVMMTIALHGVDAQPSKVDAQDTKLSEEIVSLRTEIDMREIEYAAARANLLMLVRGWGTYELLEANGHSSPSMSLAVEIRSLLGEFTVADDGLRAMVAEAIRGETLDLEAMKKRASIFRKTLQLKREEFLKLTTALNRKKLELAGLERRFRGRDEVTSEARK